ncbi:hypothetical protein SH449x_002781 [Pirellulaceae bacterium SH449]
MQTIIIIGALPNDPRRDELLARLKAATANVDWNWIQALEASSRPDEKFVRQLQAKDQRGELSVTTIVKLPMLHGVTRNQVHKLSCGIVEAPRGIETIDQLVDWLHSTDANLIPRQEWMLGTREAAFLAIISKMIRGCRWAKDVSGHSFLKHSDLMNQSPVQRRGYEAVRNSALDLLPKLIASRVILQKGANQGKTPLEYAINTSVLDVLKSMILQRSFTVLTGDSFSVVLDYINADTSDKVINASDGIINGQTIEQCHQQFAPDED